MLKTLTLRRHGKFSIETLGDSHCGLSENQTIKYEVMVICAAKPSLDYRGFLFEQRSIDEYFQRLSDRGGWTYSCEEMSIDFCKELRELIMEENPKCKILAMTVQLSAKPYLASMTYSWIRKKAI